MKFRPQLAGFALLISLSAVPACAASGSVTGVVRNSAGVPQIGAQVELLRPDLSVVTSAYTNSEGRFTIASIFPGRYALKAIDESFLPSLRENVRVRGGRTVVNLTLNTLYEVIQWLPAQPRAANARSDDWEWTLRSAANKPLLRWLKDGPLVVVREGPGGTPKLRARLMATGQAGTFGESGQRFSATVEDTPANSRELLARVDFDPATNAGMESMLGFRQDLGYVGSVQSVAAVAIQPQIEGAGKNGLMTATMSSSETMQLGPDLEAQVGSMQIFGRSDTTTMMRALPFASASLHLGSSTVTYRMATGVQSEDPGDPAELLPRFSALAGQLALEHGMHQEVGFERSTSTSTMAVLVYADALQNPVLEASASFAPGAGPAEAGVLYDPLSGLVRVAGEGYHSTGVEASYQRELPGGNLVRASYTDGGAVVMPALQQAGFAQVVAAARTQRVQAYALSFSGTLEGTHTRWKASYRWQPTNTITAVSPYEVEALAPYLNMRLCQNVHRSRDGASGVQAMLEVQNLLAQGYHPVLMSDGSILIFAQGQRAFTGGLAFTF